MLRSASKLMMESVNRGENFLLHLHSVIASVGRPENMLGLEIGRNITL